MEAAAQRQAVVEGLREQIRKLQAAPRQYLSVLRTGVGAFDRLLPGGGVPLGQALELWGEAASGRTSLALRAVASATSALRLCAWVDGAKELYPPAAAALGVDLERLLIVRPRAPAQLVWSAVQLARSGAFACVVLDLTHTGVRLSLAEGRKLVEAAGQGGGALVLLTPPEAPGEGVARLRVQACGVEGFSLEVVRDRRGGAGQRAVIPWPSLYPTSAPLYRYTDAGGAQPPPPLPRFRRLRAHEERNGHAGFYATRPGRDTVLPSLQSSLGLRGNAP